MEIAHVAVPARRNARIHNMLAAAMNQRIAFMLFLLFPNQLALTCDVAGRCMNFCTGGPTKLRIAGRSVEEFFLFQRHWDRHHAGLMLPSKLSLFQCEYAS